MIGWLVAAGLLGLFLTLKVGVCLKWESGTALLKVRVGQLRFALSTQKKEKHRTNKKAAKQSGGEKKKSSSPVKKWVKAAISHWREVLQLVGKILRAPQLERLKIHITVGNKDPEKCAMQYGKLCAGLSVGLPMVEQILPIRRKDISVRCNFELAENETCAEAEATVRFYEVFAIVISGLLLLVRIYRSMKTNEKVVG